ncbi:preprotein translocase subunit SecY [Candidatus Micrarchaeota archaeon]|nr:preprotein translocase subunit SecY [Candidatus Micrarchaeota archaeon]
MRLEFLKPIIRFLPEVKQPVRKPPLNEKVIWTLAALIIFFVMYHVEPVGAIVSKGGQNDFLQLILASKVGSLITVGIGPIILASIFLQLFVGAKIIDIDMKDPEQKKTFQGAQKLLALLLCFFESAMYVMSGNVMPMGFAGTSTLPLLGSFTFTQILVVMQLAIGSIILLYMDEIVSRYGLGSGISLFIAAGVSLAVVMGTIAIITGYGGGIAEQQTVFYNLAQGGADSIPNAIIALLPIIFTIIVFLVVTYAEGMKVEIPLAFERARGFGGRYPIKLMYVSNIPVILASALLLNLQLWTRALQNASFYVGGADVVKLFVQIDSATQGVNGGILYFLTPRFFNPLAVGYQTYFSMFFTNHVLNFPYIGTVIVPEWIHIFTYTIFLVILCVIFGRFWIETTGMGPRDVAAQLQNSGLQIPGFRRDPRVMEKILEKYIPIITILGSVFVGLLASFADLTGALGTGTGILLTVGILHRMYEDLTAQKMFDIYPDLRKIVGG